jgi:hypothetical protein
MSDHQIIELVGLGVAFPTGFATAAATADQA